MNDRKRVIKGLECCLSSVGANCPIECPYLFECLRDDDNNMFMPPMRDALMLLKAEPKEDEP